MQGSGVFWTLLLWRASANNPCLGIIGIKNNKGLFFNIKITAKEKVKNPVFPHRYFAAEFYKKENKESEGELYMAGQLAQFWPSEPRSAASTECCGSPIGRAEVIRQTLYWCSKQHIKINWYD